MENSGYTESKFAMWSSKSGRSTIKFMRMMQHLDFTPGGIKGWFKRTLDSREEFMQR